MKFIFIINHYDIHFDMHESDRRHIQSNINNQLTSFLRAPVSAGTC